MYSNLNFGDIVEVKWGDAWAAPQAKYDPNSDHSPLTRRTVGYFMQQDENSFVISWCFDEEGFSKDTGESIFSIPMSWVLEVWKYT